MSRKLQAAHNYWHWSHFNTFQPSHWFTIHHTFRKRDFHTSQIKHLLHDQESHFWDLVKSTNWHIIMTIWLLKHNRMFVLSLSWQHIYIGPPLAFVLVIFVEIIGTKYTKCVIQCLSGLSTKVISHSGRGADKWCVSNENKLGDGPSLRPPSTTLQWDDDTMT